MKKVLMIFLAIALIFTMSAPAFAQAPDQSGLQVKFDELKAAGILAGDANGNMLALDSKMQRQQLAKIACTLSGVAPTPGVDIAAFKDDYKLNVWGFDQGWIQAAYTNNLMIGKGAAGFDAKGEVTVAELLTVIIRTMGLGAQLDNNNWAASAMQVGIDNNLIPATGVNATDPATYAALVTQTYNSYAYNLAAADLAVKSITALNATQVKVEFNGVVNSTSAKDLNKYSLANVNPTAANVAIDKKSVVLTFASAEAAQAIFIVEPIISDLDPNKVSKRYTQVWTYKDTVAASVLNVAALTNSNVAKEVTVTLSEPVVSPITVTIDGTGYVMTVTGVKGVISGLTLDATSSHTLQILGLTDLAGNVSPAITKTFAVTVDTEKPTVSVSAKSDKVILLTFSKKMDDATVLAELAASKNALKKATGLSDVAYNNPVVVAGSNNTKYTIEITQSGLYGSGATVESFVLVFSDKIKDSLGNKMAATSQNITFNKDTVKPAFVGMSIIKGTGGVVEKVVVRFSEGLAAAAANTTVAPAVVDDKGVLVTGTFLGGLTSDAVAAGDTEVTYTAGSSATVIGQFTFSFPTGVVSDQAYAANASAAFTTTYNFGTAGGTIPAFALTSVTSTANDNEWLVDFGQPVVGGAVANSATDPANYVLNGAPLPTGTVITLDAARKVATITLPAASVAKSNPASVLIVSNVKNDLGAKVTQHVQSGLAVVDNIEPKLLSGFVVGDVIYLTFDEKLDISTTTLATRAAIATNFVIIVDGLPITKLPTVTMTSASVAGDDKVLAITVTSGLTYNDSIMIKTAVPGASTITDVEGNNLSGNVIAYIMK